MSIWHPGLAIRGSTAESLILLLGRWRDGFAAGQQQTQTPHGMSDSDKTPIIQGGRDRERGGGGGGAHQGVLGHPALLRPRGPPSVVAPFLLLLLLLGLRAAGDAGRSEIAAAAVRGKPEKGLRYALMENAI